MDIDVDFEFTERQRVIDDYICKKYGEENVSQITTFIGLQTKNVIKDVGKVMGIPFSETNTITKMIPADAKTIADAEEMNPEFKEFANRPENKEWFEFAKKLEGLPKTTSLHAAGVVIYPNKADECMPQAKTPDGPVACQYNMVQLEELGYLKMDFLGLKALGVEKDTIKNIKRIHGIDIDLNEIPMDDPKVLEFIGTGNTAGVFQLESAGMQKFMTELKPQSFEDLIAGISLYRPGPMDFIPAYIEGKNNRDAITYKCPQLEPILKGTYGCIVYQEQVMRIVRDLAGYTMGQSDNVRRAMSKKKQYVIDEERANFVYGNEKKGIKGCIANGISEEIANSIYDSMVNFAKYAFNKSHAAAYAVISMQTAWLKYYYPAEYMAAMLSSVADKSDQLRFYLQACKKEKITVLIPDINKSECKFIPEIRKAGEGKETETCIRYGFSGIKGVSATSGALIEQNRHDFGEYKSYADVIERFFSAGLKKTVIENLANTGVFDCFPEGHRKQYAVNAGDALKSLSVERKTSVAGQISLFDMFNDDMPSKITLKEVTPYTYDEQLEAEYATTGVYISGHPLAEWEDFFNKHTTHNSFDFISDPENGIESKLVDEQKVTVGGLITAIKVVYTKKESKAMAFITIEDLLGSIECVVFPKSYEEYKRLLVEKQKIVINGIASVDDDKVSVIANEIQPMESFPRKVWVRVPELGHKAEEIAELSKGTGNDWGIIYYEKSRQKQTLGQCVDASKDLRSLYEKFGKDNVKVVF